MRYVAVVGSGECSPEIGSLAYEVGKELARRKAVVLCGGRGGVMAEVARGVREEGGLVIGILPGTSRSEGNPYLSFSLPTGLGEARNAVIACAADVLIAVGGGYGTLSEVALALKRGKKVIGLAFSFPGIPGVIPASSPSEAVDLALSP
ncbi:TIGR00725 family protein [Ammonifex thiophilus]|uniref:TIGR00725 family protein n=1 Tax=Ammonifex thiophilus TaxID=444093 RepID=A0A3D8P6G9_9THEO|nr:TIGR00725 family protein [Ammonifex thiophilus]RDV83954.1 TIGR00725 family protein [Ammonifex thiophilus]